jgi:hypothetical protein
MAFEPWVDRSRASQARRCMAGGGAPSVARYGVASAVALGANEVV